MTHASTLEAHLPLDCLSADETDQITTDLQSQMVANAIYPYWEKVAELEFHLQSADATLAQAHADVEQAAGQASHDAEQARATRTRVEELELELGRARASLAESQQAQTMVVKEKEQLEEALRRERVRAAALEGDLETTRASAQKLSNAYAEVQGNLAVSERGKAALEDMLMRERDRARQVGLELEEVKESRELVRREVGEWQRVETTRVQALEHNLHVTESWVQAMVKNARETGSISATLSQYITAQELRVRELQKEVETQKRCVQEKECTLRSIVAFCDSFTRGIHHYGVRYQNGAFVFTQETFDQVADLMEMAKRVSALGNQPGGGMFAPDSAPGDLRSLLTTMKNWLIRLERSQFVSPGQYNSVIADRDSYRTALEQTKQTYPASFTPQKRPRIMTTLTAPTHPGTAPSSPRQSVFPQQAMSPHPSSPHQSVFPQQAMSPRQTLSPPKSSLTRHASEPQIRLVASGMPSEMCSIIRFDSPAATFSV